MDGMDPQLKGIILNCTLKSYSISPIKGLMCLRSQLASMGVSSTRAPARGGGTGSGRRSSCHIQEGSFLGANPLLIAWPIPFPCHPGSTSMLAIATAFSTQTGDIVDEIKMMHDKCNYLAQETEDAVKEGARMSNWVLDLKAQKYDVQKKKSVSWNKIWKIKKRNWHSLRPGKKRWKLLVWRVQ